MVAVAATSDLKQQHSDSSRCVNPRSSFSARKGATTMSIEAIAWAFKKAKTDDPITKFVLIAICNYTDDRNMAWPSIKTLCGITGLARRTVQGHLRKLEELGILSRLVRRRQDGGQTSSCYTVHFGHNSPPGDPGMDDELGSAEGAHAPISPPKRRRASNAPPIEEPSVNRQLEPSLKKKESAPLALSSDWPADYQDQFWEAYGHKRDKTTAMKALEKVHKKGIPWAKLMAGIERYRNSTSYREGYIKHPATFLNAGSWENEYNGKAPGRSVGFGELFAEMSRNG
jgi:DNA-binding transcriptional ArsR family regulator